MSEYLRAELVKALIRHFGADNKRIDHALRVTSWAERIRDVEGGDPEVVLAVGLLHDVGIKVAEERHGRSDGNLQEEYGPAIVRSILEETGFPAEKIEECCAIVGAHHTAEGVPGPNFPIMWDADMLVNLRDELRGVPRDTLESIIEKSFTTETGKRLARKELLS